MSDLTRYRINTNKLSFGEGEVIAALKHSTILVPDDTLQQIAEAVAGYAFMQGGISGALYACEKADADFVMIPKATWDGLVNGADTP